MKRPLIILGGTTASGKSRIAIELAKQINGVIINGDSRQIYKELSIGTARPTEEEMSDIPHYLYGYISVKDSYSIYNYQQDVYTLLKQIPKEKACIIVGGTGLYIDSVIYDYHLQKDVGNNAEDLRSLNLEELQRQISPEILNTLNNSEKHNPRRLIRIIQRGSLPIPSKEPLFPIKYFVIDLPDEIIRNKVEQRVEKMFNLGLEKECRYLWTHGYFRYPALNSIGYIEFKEYFNGDISLDKVKNEIITNTIKYIKRQRTWFKHHKDAIFTSDMSLIQRESQSLLKRV